MSMRLRDAKLEAIRLKGLLRFSAFATTFIDGFLKAPQKVLTSEIFPTFRKDKIHINSDLLLFLKTVSHKRNPKG